MNIMLANVKPENWSLSNGISGATALLGLAIVVVLLWLTVSALLKEKGNGGGDMSGAAKRVVTILIILCIPVIGASAATAMGFGEAILRIIDSLFSLGKD